MGEVGLATRSMLANRLGRPRSWARAAKLPRMPAMAPSRALRRSAGRPVRSAPAPSSDEPAASPPRKR